MEQTKANSRAGARVALLLFGVVLAIVLLFVSWLGVTLADRIR
jgi:hypothetical protein